MNVDPTPMSLRAGMRLSCIGLVVLMTGCSTLDRWLYQGYSVSPLDGDGTKAYAQLVKSLTSSVDGNKALVQDRCFTLSTADSTCQAQRNQAVAALMVGSDELCDEHRRSIYGRDAAWNVTTGTLTSLFSGAAAVVTSERRKTILAALALFSNSERSLVNETVYKQIIVTSVDKKIVEKRRAQQDAMSASIRKPLNDYGVAQAVHDVVTYHRLCSFKDGLQWALTEGTEGTNTQKILRLRANADAITSRMTLLRPDSAEYAEAKTRLQAVTEALKPLESQ
jgi:hypothetical protein